MAVRPEIVAASKRLNAATVDAHEVDGAPPPAVAQMLMSSAIVGFMAMGRDDDWIKAEVERMIYFARQMGEALQTAH